MEMRKLSTIQKREKLNTVFAADEPGVGGADHALCTGHLVRL